MYVRLMINKVISLIFKRTLSWELFLAVWITLYYLQTIHCFTENLKVKTTVHRSAAELMSLYCLSLRDWKNIHLLTSLKKKSVQSLKLLFVCLTYSG